MVEEVQHQRCPRLAGCDKAVDHHCFLEETLASGHNEVTSFLPFVMILQMLLLVHQAKSKGLPEMQPPGVEELINAHMKELIDDLFRSPVRKT
jgi:hypothetical protein